MDTQVEPIPADELPRRRVRVTAGLVAVAAFVVMLLAIGVGIYTSRAGGGNASGSVTIAQLLADPNRYDGRDVTVSGQAEDVRALPYLSQYAIYTLRDDTGTLRVLSQRGTPPAGAPVRVTGTYHAKAKLDDALKRIVAERFGDLAGSIAASVVPDVGLHVVFMEHQKYEVDAP